MTRIKDLIVNSNCKHDNLQGIKTKLAQNSLVELRLGFEEREFRSKRDIQSLIKVIEEKFYHQLSLHKHSCLKSICIGWRLPPFALGPVLRSVIPALLQEPVRVTHIQLNLNNNPSIPEEYLRRILSWHSLESLDLRSITLRVRSTSSMMPLTPLQQPATRRDQLLRHQLQQRTGIVDNTITTTNNNNNNSTKESGNDSENWKQANIVTIVPYLTSSVKSLKLMNCGINEHHIPKLCESIRRRMHGLKNLCLRQNFTLDGGYHHLFALPRIRSLDLSLCDLDENDGYLIGRAIEKCENEDLERLSLAGNYRLSVAVPEIVRAAATTLTEVDCSFCGVNTKSQRQVFAILAESSSSSSCPKDQKCTIQSFRMQGILLSDVEGLVNCIRNNTSLRHLVVDHPHEVRSISMEGMHQIVTALKSNYSLEVLRFDVIQKKNLGILEDIDFWLKLNQCGRRALLQANEGINSWSTILGQGAKSKDHNILFWLLKHGSAMFTNTDIVPRIQVQENQNVTN